MAEIIRLKFDIPGVAGAEEGDNIIIDPDNPDPEYRLVRVRALDPSLLPLIRAAVAKWEREHPGE